MGVSEWSGVGRKEGGKIVARFGTEVVPVFIL